jgi:transposase
MSKIFRPWKIDEPLLLPPLVQDFVAEDHLARFVLGLVRDEIDLCAIIASYDSDRGQPPFDPVMMTALLLYSYCCGIYSSRQRPHWQAVAPSSFWRTGAPTRPAS